MPRPLGRRVLHQPWILRQPGVVPGAPQRPITVVSTARRTALLNARSFRHRGSGVVDLRQDGIVTARPAQPITIVDFESVVQARQHRQRNQGRTVRGLRQTGIVPGAPVEPITVVPAWRRALAQLQRARGGSLLITGPLTTPPAAGAPTQPITVITAQACCSIFARIRKGGARILVQQGAGIFAVPPIAPQTLVLQGIESATVARRKVRGHVELVTGPLTAPVTSGNPTAPVTVVTEIAGLTARARAQRGKGRSVGVFQELQFQAPAQPVTLVEVAGRTSKAHGQRVHGRAYVITPTIAPPPSAFPAHPITIVTQAVRSVAVRLRRRPFFLRARQVGVAVAPSVGGHGFEVVTVQHGAETVTAQHGGETVVAQHGTEVTDT